MASARMAARPRPHLSWPISSAVSCSCRMDKLIRHGMTFSGTTTGGGTFSGTLQNKNGAGYSKTDGFGFINAEAAVHLKPR